MVMEMKSVVRVVRSGALKTHPVQDKSAKPFPIYDQNRPFYSCLLSDLASGWQRGWS